MRASDGRCVRTSAEAKRCRRDCIAGQGAARECLERCGTDQPTRELMCAQSRLDACDTLRRVFAFLFEEGAPWRGVQTCGDVQERFTFVTRSLDAERSTLLAELDSGTQQARYEGGYDPATGIVHLRATAPVRGSFPPFELAGYLLDGTPPVLVGATAAQCKLELERPLR